jgi:hypothetical protein
MDPREMGCDGVNWIQQAQNGVQWQVFCEHCNEPSCFIKAGTFSQVAWWGTKKGLGTMELLN